MLQTLRSKILAISTATVVGALAITGAATYHIVRGSTFQTIEQDLDAITAGNTMAIDQWVAAKGLAVSAAAAVIETGDPQGFAAHMGKASGFPITTVGWEDKTFKSTTSTPPDYDPTARPWYKTAVQAGKLTLTKPYGDSTTGVPYVAFVAPMLRAGTLQGVISGAVPLEGVREVVSAIRPTPSSLGFVVSRDGQVLAHADAKLLLKPVSEISELLTPAALASLAGAKAPLEVDLGGSAKLLKARPVQGTDWLLLVALDKAEATTGLQSVVRTLAIAIVLLACIAAAVAAALTAQSFRRLSQVRDAMDRIGSGGGDLTQRLPVSGRDEVAQIASSFNAFVEQIGTVLKDVRNGVESMKTATDEIKLGNLDLSNRTESSASALQQTSASLSQLTANVRQSAEAAAMATRLAQTASASATKGGDVVGGAVSTMDDISRASSKIGEIIGVIDAIAFQTNILALNAAVEAARAGEQGRGFAVVAAEVRSLAHRSATAAKEIKALIDASGASVALGTDRVRAAGQTMGEIVDGIQRVSQIIVEINGAMTEQSVGIAQINQAVAEMDRSTQQNAALVEESTAASSVLNEQAHHLSRTVAGFTLDGRAPARDQLLLTN
ncbi:Ribose and galactose chemoreceptor protein [Delftia tsuruhatensis]|uniref:methyl-accepting chemotaxis protein n=1 Tax=Delftia tsuruhatensis TaxID=180282 RepID=UPI001E7479EF|nr:methyl-accepting chemotaxis protein [Delftia tsuruhatensis]CAB5698674.1 Ribose and galactose chemoreceptor protein [Delftia tsuruhatensis]CAC9676462.1 Ribose and galactose chemoreceptor protein [Delftia tsuruhatensis]